MAGLQYNFFPTDFFYPRPQTVKVDTAATTTQKSAALPLQIQEREVMITDDLKPKHHPASLVLHNNKHGHKIGTPMNKRTAWFSKLFREFSANPCFCLLCRDLGSLHVEQMEGTFPCFLGFKFSVSRRMYPVISTGLSLIQIYLIKVWSNELFLSLTLIAPWRGIGVLNRF